MIFYATFYKTNKNKDIKNKYYLDKKILKNFKNKSLQ